MNAMKDYDEVYGRDEFYWGRGPNNFCIEVSDLAQNLIGSSVRVMDLGSGEGRDCIYFAGKGFRVSGVELSPEGVSKSLKWALASGFSVSIERGDLNLFRLCNEYDVIYSSGTLTFIRPEIRPEIFRNCKEHTSAGGMNAFNVFIRDPETGKPPDWGDEEHFFEPEELASFYSDWKIEVHREERFNCSSGGVEHRHHMETLVAVKP